MCPKRRRRLVPGLHGDLDMADPAADKLREYRDVLPLWLSMALLRACSDQSITFRGVGLPQMVAPAAMPRGRREAARPRVPRASRPPPTPSVTARDIIATPLHPSFSVITPVHATSTSTYTFNYYPAHRSTLPCTHPSTPLASTHTSNHSPAHRSTNSPTCPAHSFTISHGVQPMPSPRHVSCGAFKAFRQSLPSKPSFEAVPSFKAFLQSLPSQSLPAKPPFATIC